MSLASRLDCIHRFCSSDLQGGGSHTLLFVSILRLDLSNRIVVLDDVKQPFQDNSKLRLEFSSRLLKQILRTIIANEAEPCPWNYLSPHGLISVALGQICLVR